MDKRKIRDCLRLAEAIVFGFLYFPHFIIYQFCHAKNDIKSDLVLLRKQINISLPLWLSFLYLLHNNKYYRNLFYYRIGPIKALFVKWYRKGYSSFIIPDSTRIGKGLSFAHPYSTVLNAESIGDYFSCIHCTTLGKKTDKRPIIGNNVTVGCNVCIIGGVHIGNNVTIGAGSVVVKDVPDNCIIAGNPARIIKYLES